MIDASPGYIGIDLGSVGELLALLAALRVVAEEGAELAGVENKLLPLELGLEGEDASLLLQERYPFN